VWRQLQIENCKMQIRVFGRGPDSRRRDGQLAITGLGSWARGWLSARSHEALDLFWLGGKRRRGIFDIRRLHKSFYAVPSRIDTSAKAVTPGFLKRGGCGPRLAIIDIGARALVEADSLRRVGGPAGSFRPADLCL